MFSVGARGLTKFSKLSPDLETLQLSDVWDLSLLEWNSARILNWGWEVRNRGLCNWQRFSCFDWDCGFLLLTLSSGVSSQLLGLLLLAPSLVLSTDRLLRLLSDSIGHPQGSPALSGLLSRSLHILILLPHGCLTTLLILLLSGHLLVLHPWRLVLLSGCLGVVDTSKSLLDRKLRVGVGVVG